MAKKITFPGSRIWDPNRDSISFKVEVDGKKTRCLISREALEDHFGADRNKTVEQAFDVNLYVIESAARKIINNNVLDPQGEYLIRSQDM
jgi:ribosomal protein L28